MKRTSSLFIGLAATLLIVGGLVYGLGSHVKTTNAQSLGSSGLVSTNTGQSTGTAVATTGDSGTGDQVVSLLRNLSVIQLSDAVFQDPGFALLQDISVALPPVTNQGRRNPFAQVGNDPINEFASSSSSQTTPDGSASSSASSTVAIQ